MASRALVGRFRGWGIFLLCGLSSSIARLFLSSWRVVSLLDSLTQEVCLRFGVGRSRTENPDIIGRSRGIPVGVVVDVGVGNAVCFRVKAASEGFLARELH